MANEIILEAVGYHIYSQGLNVPYGDFMDPELDKVFLLGSVTGAIRVLKGAIQAALGAIATLATVFLCESTKKFTAEGLRDLGRGAIAVVPGLGTYVLSKLDKGAAKMQEALFKRLLANAPSQEVPQTVYAVIDGNEKTLYLFSRHSRQCDWEYCKPVPDTMLIETDKAAISGYYCNSDGKWVECTRDEDGF